MHQVKFGITINQVTAIDDMENTFSVDFFLQLEWTGDADSQTVDTLLCETCEVVVTLVHGQLA